MSGVFISRIFLCKLLFSTRERNIIFLDKNKGRTEQNQPIDGDVIMQGRFGCSGTFRGGQFNASTLSTRPLPEFPFFLNITMRRKNRAMFRFVVVQERTEPDEGEPGAGSQCSLPSSGNIPRIYCQLVHYSDNWGQYSAINRQ